MSVEKTIFRMCSCLMNYTFTTYYSYPAMKTIVGYFTRILKSWCESQFCLPLVSFCLWTFPVNKSEKCISHSVLESAFLKRCLQGALVLLSKNFPALRCLSPRAFPDLKCQNIKQMELQLEHWFGGEWLHAFSKCALILWKKTSGLLTKDSLNLVFCPKYYI